jgi:hypothetical protein
MKEIQAFSGALWRTLGVLMRHIGALFSLFFASTCGLCGRRKTVTAFSPLLHYALFQDDSTQLQVVRNKGLTTNLLDKVALAARGRSQG